VIVGAIAVLNASPAGADQTVAQAAPAPSASPTASPPPHLLQVSGYADAGYTSASIASAVGSPGGSFITGRVFDDLNQQIQFHNFNVQVAYNGPIGGKIETILGDDANVTNSWPKSQLSGAPSLNPTQTVLTGPDFDITQAYLSLTSGEFTGIVGKFETLAGAEVIESPSDLNFSRSILFGFAVPFTHTGGRLTWAMNSNVSFVAGLNKGWDTVYALNAPQNNFLGAPPFNDTNSLTIEGGAIWNPSKALSLTLDGYTGQVEEGFNVAVPGLFVVNPARPVKSLIDAVITWHATSALTFVLNSDNGLQTNSNILNGPGTAIVGYGTGTWSGMAGYASYAINSAWTATLRGEYFGDYGGLRTGLSMRWAEGTATLAYAPNSNIILRGEVRGDRTNQPYFIGLNGNRYYSNAQFGIEAIVKWP
jgi:Putative beta-barrel porin-2, OmpL-like. bbp2